MVLLSMPSPSREDSPRVTRRRTTDGDNPPPQEFDKGWSSFRGKRPQAGFSSSLPLACENSTHPPSDPYARFVLRFFFAAPPVQQARWPASSVKTSTVVVCMATLHISPLPHYCTLRLHSLPPRHRPKLALSFAGITSGRGGQRATLPATSSKKSRAGLSLTLSTSLRCRTTPLHALPYSHHYACFILRLPCLLKGGLQRKWQRLVRLAKQLQQVCP